MQAAIFLPKVIVHILLKKEWQQGSYCVPGAVYWLTPSLSTAIIGQLQEKY